MKNIRLYEEACNGIVKHFAKKQDIEFYFWVADEVGEIACFIGEYFFNMSDIVRDIKTNQPKGLILEWHNHIVENSSCINYKAYISGLRHKDL